MLNALLFIAACVSLRSETALHALNDLSGVSYFGKILVVFACLLITRAMVQVFYSIGYGLIPKNVDFATGICRVGVGFAVACIAATAGAHAQILYWQLWMAVIAGILIASKNAQKHFRTDLKNLRRTIAMEAQNAPVIFVLIFLYGTACFLLTWFPDPYVDVHYYHLLSAWKWAQAGGFYHLQWMPFYLQGGYAEYFYSVLALLVRDAMALVIAGQMLHFCLGWIASCVVVYQLARKILQRSWVLFTVFVFITLPCEYVMLLRAKNDGFVLFFSMLLLLTASMKSSTAQIFCLYFFAAFLLGLKHSAIFFLVPFFLLWFFLQKKDARLWRSHFIAFTSVWLIGIFVSARNFWFTGNPFFPAMSELFPGKHLVDSYIGRSVASFTYVPGNFREIVEAQLHYFYGSKPIFYVAIFALFVKGPARFFATLGILAAILFAVLTGQGYSVRFMFFMYGVLAITSVFVWQKLTQKDTQQSRVFAGIFLVIACVNAGMEVPWSRLQHFFLPLYGTGVTYARFFDGLSPYYTVHRWANARLQNPYILSSYENEALFLDGKLSVAPNLLEASRVANAKSYGEFLHNFRAGGFTHLQIADSEMDLFRNYEITAEFRRDFAKIFTYKQYRLYALKANLPAPH